MDLDGLGVGRGRSECGALVVTEWLRDRAGPHVDKRHFVVDQGLSLVVFVNAPPAVAALGLVVMDPGCFGNAGFDGLGRA